MLGAIIGDIVGSRFEFNNHKSKEFEFMTEQCEVTDDSIMTLAIAEAFMACQGDFTEPVSYTHLDVYKRQSLMLRTKTTS